MLPAPPSLLTGQHLKTQVTSSMVCGTFLKNGKPDNSKSCQVFDYEKDPESLQDVQIARERVLLTGEEASLSPFTTPAFG